MNKLTKLFIEGLDIKKAYSNLLSRKYPDLTPEEADTKVVENIKAMQQLPLDEAPIDQFQTIGDFKKGSSFTSPTDRAILSSPKAVEKIKDKFNNVEQVFDMYFVNTKEGRNYSEIGEVSEDFIKNNLKIDVPINKNNITVFYTNNKGDRKVMMTAWIIAHRFGHAIQRGQKNPAWKYLEKEVNEWMQRIMKDAYQRDIRFTNFGSLADQKDELLMKNFAQMVGTFKSARDKNLRNYAEFHHELLAQYITTGKISFNPLPKFVPVKYAWGKPSMGVSFKGNDVDYGYYSDYLDSLAEIYPDYANTALDSCRGKIYVM